MDIIFLKNLKIDTIIGIFDWERVQKQTIILDIEMAFDTRKASKTDDIADALDYKSVSDAIIEFVENSHFYLIEKLIAEIAELVQTKFHVPWIKITLNKKGAVGAGIDVGIVIERSIN